ncbi:MAG: PAS domain S-box protein [Actinobacteria bacterium]|nr:PAS domain S-box protein [Actinomycetota bacterium]
MSASASGNGKPTAAQSNRDYRFLAEAVPAQVWTAGPDGALEYVNKRVLDYFDRSFEEMIGWGWKEVVHSDDVTATLERWTHALETGDPYETEFRLRRRDGAYRWHLGRAFAMRDEHGRIVKWFGANRDIDDQRGAERHARLIVETTAEGIWTTNAEHRVTFANSAMADMLGYPVEELPGMQLAAFLPPATHDLVEPHFRQLKDGTREQLDVKLVRKDGVRLWTSVSVSALFDEEGQYAGVLGMVTDISERKRIEQRRSAQHQVTRVIAETPTLAEAVPRILSAIGKSLGWQAGVIWRVDRSEDVLRVVGAWSAQGDESSFVAASKRMVVERGVDLPGKAWASGLPEWIPSLPRAAVFSRSETAQQDGLRSGFAFPMGVEEIDGIIEFFFADETSGPDGEILAMITLIGSQIAERIRREESAEAVRDSEALTRTVLDASGVGIAMVDLDGNVLVRNAPMQAMEEELFGGPAVAEGIQVAAELAGRLTESERFLGDLEAIRANPNYEGLAEYHFAETGRSFQRYTAQVKGSGGAPLGRIFVVREVTAERSAERLKSDLVATVSHELRTPLSGILGFTELLVDQDVDPVTRRRYLEMTYKEAKRLTGLLDDFLDLQRIEQGGLRLASARFALRPVLADAVELFSGQSAVHELRLEPEAGSLLVRGDRDRIAQVVGNLLSNAIKYSPGGGPVDVGVESSDGRVKVSVADRGIGIPAEQQDLVFERFFRGDSTDARSIGGTGLGLTLCREIVHAHGGEIGLVAAEGAGTTFWFELPVASGHTCRLLPKILPREQLESEAKPPVI